MEKKEKNLEEFLRFKRFPKNKISKGEKSNFGHTHCTKNEVFLVKNVTNVNDVINELHSVPVSPNVMSQTGADLPSLLEADGFCYLMVCIDYFSK